MGVAKFLSTSFEYFFYISQKKRQLISTAVAVYWYATNFT